MKNFNIINKNGITLKTANTYVNDNINVRLPEVDNSKLIPENIRQGINILGVEGTITIPKGTYAITANGSYDITNYATANVNVPVPEGYIIPEGTYAITANGTYDITQYASTTVNVPVPEGNYSITANGDYDIAQYSTVNVNVPIPEGYIIPEGQLDITENGVHDVTSFATVNVNVAGSGGEDYLARMINNTLTEYKTTEVISIPNNFFVKTSELHKIDAPLNTLNYSSASESSFYGTELDTLILRGDAVVGLPHIDVLNKAHILKHSWCDGFIIVKDELINSYKSATNWSTFADKIYPLSDYDADKLPFPTYEWISGTTLKWDPSYGRMFTPTSSIKYGIVKISFHITEGGYNTVKIGTWVANKARLLLSNLDTTLASNNTIDSTNVYANLSNTSVGNITTYSNIPAGDHFIYVKYIYGSSSDYSNFHLRF